MALFVNWLEPAQSEWDAVSRAGKTRITMREVITQVD